MLMLVYGARDVYKSKLTKKTCINQFFAVMWKELERESFNLQNQFESWENEIWKVAVAEERFLSAMLTWSFVYDV